MSMVNYLMVTLQLFQHLQKWKQNLLIFFCFLIDGQSDVEVEVDLIAKKYVERGSSVTLICKHNVEPEKLYKVTWLKGSGKVFEYINGRQPPYRNFSVPGAEIDVRSNRKRWNLIFQNQFTFLTVSKIKSTSSDTEESRLWCVGLVLLWSITWFAHLHKSFKWRTSSCHS